MRKIRVLEMIDQTFLGGGQINLLALARALDPERFDVVVCSKPGGPLVDELSKHGIRHWGAPFRKTLSPDLVQGLMSLIRGGSFDIVHTHGGVAGLYGRWAARRSGVPVILHTLHGIHYLHYRNPLLRALYVVLERLFSRFTQAVIFVSDADRRRGRKHRLAPADRMTVIKNGIDTEAFVKIADKEDSTAAFREEFGIAVSQPVVGTVARLHRQKGIPILMKAARGVLRSFPQAKVVVVGGGPLENRLLALRRRWGLEGEVLFTGERPDVPRLMARFDVFVLPSLWEGLPYSLIEAAALSKPVVATCVDGIEELVKDGQTGLLVPPKNPEALARAVVRLLENKRVAAELGERLHRDVVPRFTLTRMVAQTQSLYLRLAKEAGL